MTASRASAAATNDPSTEMLVLQIDGFEDQLEVLLFARYLEANERVDHVALMQGTDLSDVSFCVRVASVRALDEALHDLVAFEPVDCSLVPGGLKARLSPPNVSADAESIAQARSDAPPIAAGPARSPKHGAVRRSVAPAATALTGRVQPSAAEFVRELTRGPAFEPPVVPVPAAADIAPPPDDARAIAPEERPGGPAPLAEQVTLVIYPFHSFSALSEFQQAVAALRGVKGVRVRRFYKGTLQLVVEYEDALPLSDRLRDLPFPGSVVSTSPREIRMQLRVDRPAIPDEWPRGDRPGADEDPAQSADERRSA